MITSVSHTNIVKLSVIRRERAVASSPFGPVRAGLTTLPTIERDHLPTELLNSLVREVVTLHSKSYTDCATSIIAMQDLLAKLSASITEKVSTDVKDV